MELFHTALSFTVLSHLSPL